MFCATFNLDVYFRPKMALTLEILSHQMHTLPRNSAGNTLSLFFATFKRSKSALCHLLCEATCSLRIDYFTVVCSVIWPLNGSEARGDLALIMTSLLLSCKRPSKYYNNLIYTAKTVNKVTCSLAAIQWPGHWANNCKMVYWQTAR